MSVDHIKRLGDSIIESAIRQSETVNEVLRLREENAALKEDLKVCVEALLEIMRGDVEPSTPDQEIAQEALEKVRKK